MKNLSIKLFNSNNITAWGLLLPYAIGLFAFFIYALTKSLYYSFTEYDLFSDSTWVGLDNYASLLGDPLFAFAVFNSFSFAFIVTIVQTALALIFAVILNNKIRGRRFFTTVFYLPSIMSSAAITLIFIWFYQRNGFFNEFLTNMSNLSILIVIAICAYLFVLNFLYFSSNFLKVQKSWSSPFNHLLSLLAAIVVFIGCYLVQPDLIGNHKVEINWLGSREQIGPLPLTLWAIVIQNIFTTVPTMMLLFLAGLQSVSKELYEAADVDNANHWQKFIWITVPQLKPITYVVVTMGLIGTLQMFDQVALLGETVPLESRITLAYYVYHNAFPSGEAPNVGLASAAAITLGVITLILIYLQKKFGVSER